MWDKVADMAKKHWFWIAVVAAALVKQILVIGLPIYAIPSAACDDQLLKNWAFSMASLDWKGAFNAYTFAKEPGFSFFLAVCFRLHLPYIFTITLGYSVASIVFATSLNKIFSRKIFVFFTYLVMLFNPVSFGLYTLQRVYRNGFAMVLTLLVFGGLIHMYFAVLEQRQRQVIVWSLVSSLSLGYLWITKSDTVWMLPFALAVCGVMFVILVLKSRNVKSIPSFFCVVFPFLSIFLFSQATKFCDIHWYGYSSVAYYDEVMYDLAHIKSNDVQDKISLSRKQLRDLYEISPTLASVEKYVEKQMQKYSEFDTHPDDGEVEAGWAGWALLEGFSKAGVYDSCENANAFYRSVHEELEAAFADGRLEKQTETMAQKYYIDTPEHRGELAKCIWRTIQYMASYAHADAQVMSSGDEDELAFRQFEEITRNKVAYDRLEHDFMAAGWIVFPEYDADKMQVYVEDEKGNQYAQVKFRRSSDVQEYLENTEYAKGNASRCRFRVEWDVKDGQENTQWYLAVHQEGMETGRVRIEKSGFAADTELPYTGSLDAYLSQAEGEIVLAKSNQVVGRLGVISSLYRILGPGMLWLGMICYGALTIVVILDFKKKRYGCGNAWLIATGFGLSVIVFSLGISFVELTQCPAISEMYLSSAYGILVGAQSISIWKCVELAIPAIGRNRKRKELS